MAEYGINGTTLNLNHIQMKARPSTQWSEDEVLLAGEIGIELDTGKFKAGDGTKTWKELPYSADPKLQNLVDQMQEQLDAADTTLESHGARLDALDGENGEIAGLKSKDTAHETRMGTIEAKDSEQDGRLSVLEGITTLSANPFRE